MLSLNELEQLVAFADCGRLSKAAESLNISQPTLTRSMQHLEYEFGVPLFERTKNSITLTATGMRAVEYARALLRDAESAKDGVAAFYRSLNTITVASCAPAPLWYLLPALTSAFPGFTISSLIKDTDEVIAEFENGSCTVAVIPEDYSSEAHPFVLIPFLRENLFIRVPDDHELASRSEVSFSDINGYNFLRASNLGFWYKLSVRKMPASRFHIQENDYALMELIRESSLPSFVTNLSMLRRGRVEGRVDIPISDEEAHVTFRMLFRADGGANEKALRRVAESIRADSTLY